MLYILNKILNGRSVTDLSEKKKKKHRKKSKFRMLIFTNNETKHSTVTASVHTQ